jgi:hypothetical protein
MLLTGLTPFIGKDEGETRRKMAAGKLSKVRT